MATTETLPTLSEVLGDTTAVSSHEAYIAHLTALSLPQLLQEPATLASEASFLTSEITNLCHSQYQTFLSLHTASTALSDSFSSFSSSLSALVESVPALETQCSTFAQETKELREERRKVTAVLDQQEKLLDILEIPQLIDTCVKNGYYQEALDLANHTNSLVKRFPNTPIIRSVEVEVINSINQMHSQLLQLLQEPAKWPSLSKAVNFLRRMNILDEEELALAFLTSRGAYMRSLFEAIERERTMDASRFLKKWIELWREGVWDIVNLFTSIFLDRPPPTSHSNLPPDLRPFLTTFAHSLINQLLSILARTIPQITDSPALSSLLTQLSYCSSYFARIGLEFRSLLPPIFEKAALDNFRKGIEDANSSLQSTLEKALGTKRGTPVRLPSTWMIQADAISDPPSLPVSATTGTATYIPSSILVSYPPFATLLNATLTSLNSLRLLAPISLLPQLLLTLDLTLTKTSSTLLAYLQQSLNRQRRSFDLSDSSAEADVREKNVALGVTKAWVYVVKFVRRGLVEGVYNNGRTLDEEGGVDWTAWEEWLKSVGGGDLLPLSGVVEVMNGEVQSNGVDKGLVEGQASTEDLQIA